MESLVELLSSQHWTVVLFLTLLATIVISKVIAWACDHFEPAAGYVGRHWPPGVKGATVNAIGSSMPELWTTVGLLFFIGGKSQGEDLLGAGISVTAGSAVFNSIVIPMCVIFAVSAPFMIKLLTLGISRIRTDLTVVDEFQIDKSAVGRDLCFLLIAELTLIAFLASGKINLEMCIALLIIYGIYVFVMWYQTKQHQSDTDEADYAGWSLKRALTTLAWTCIVLVAACYVLAELIVISADCLGIHPILTALFFGAAASSVPDIILSVKDARKGEYEDAIANAVGSNTFDICVALGLPMTIFILLFGEINLPEHRAVEMLRIGLLIFTVLVVAVILVPKYVRLWQGWVMMGLYVLWTAFALNSEFHWFF